MGSRSSLRPDTTPLTSGERRVRNADRYRISWAAAAGIARVQRIPYEEVGGVNRVALAGESAGLRIRVSRDLGRGPCRPTPRMNGGLTTATLLCAG
jgi:hypothetical protein